MQRRTYRTLDGLRAAAALVVVIFHSHTLIGRQIAPGGYLAVDLFFLLSGFVISHAYEDKLASGMKWPAFAWLRLVRLYPLYLLGLVIGVVRLASLKLSHQPLPLSLHDVPLAVIPNIFMSPSMLATGDLFPLNIPAWSLFFELGVSALYGVILFRLGVWSLAAIAAAALAVLVYFSIAHGDASLGSSHGEIAAGVARCLFSFCVGMLIYRVRPDVPIKVGPAVVAVFIAVVMLFPAPGSLRAGLDLLCIAVLFPAVVVLAVRVEPGGRLAEVYRFCGAVSYAVYAIHYPLISMARAAARWVHAPGWLLAAVLVAALLVLCGLIDRFYDRPVRRWLLRGSPVREGPEATAP